MADTKFEMILKMFFLKINNADVSFNEKTLTWKCYITNEALPTTKQVQLVDPKEFVIAALDADSKTYVMHVAIRKRKETAMHPDKKAQIKAQTKAQSETQSGAQVGALIFNKASNEVATKYSDYSNVVSAENAAKLPENTGMNEHAIKLKEGKQSFFGHIYSLGPMELETLKTYIEIIPANGFIYPSKSPAEAPILFDRKLDRSLCLCVDY